MPILNLQRRQTEVGRIRLGTSQDKTSKAGKAFREPVKLETFRFTTRSEALIRQVAELYGGEPALEQIHGDGARMWDVITGANAIAVIAPPNPVSQWMEHWIGGVCQRRCDTVRDAIKDRPCQCDPDPRRRQCKPTTRISLMLADAPGIGVWRLESHGFYAATELPAVAELLAAIGGYVPARLEVEERQVLREKQGGGTELRRFLLPVLHVDVAPRQLLAIGGGEQPAAIGAGEERAALPAGPAETWREAKPGDTPGQSEPEGVPPQPSDVDWYAKVAACQTLPQLRALWEELGGAKVADDDLKKAWWARKAAIDKATRDQTATPTTPAEQEPDRDAVWGEILRLGAERGWNTPTVSRLMQETVGHEPSTADGWTFVQFRDAIKEGRVTA